MLTPESLGDEGIDFVGRHCSSQVIAALVEGPGTVLIRDPDGAGAGGHVDAADVSLLDGVDADVEAVSASMAEVILEQRVEPVHIAVGIGGFDLGVVVVEADRLTTVGNADQQGASPFVQQAGNRLDDYLLHRLVLASLLDVPSGSLLVLDYAALVTRQQLLGRTCPSRARSEDRFHESGEQLGIGAGTNQEIVADLLGGARQG